MVESFGLFNNGKGTYERSVFNTLANGESHYEMTTIKHGKQSIDEPRITVLAAGHPNTIIELLYSEMRISADGFFSRWLILNPPTVFLSLS